MDPSRFVKGRDLAHETMSNAHQACQGLPNPEEAYQQCLHILETHRMNYDSNGPNPMTLQILWWEFPPEHWEGSCLNFLKAPSPCMHDNANLTLEQAKVAATFIDELGEL